MRGARTAAVAGMALAALAALPAPAAAHGIVGRSDLPIPAWLFAWAAAMVLVFSFVALAVLWPEPRLERERWRPLGGALGRPGLGRVAEPICGGVGVLLLGLVVWSGLLGEQVPSTNLAPTLVYVIFWVGLVPLSVLFGDVFRLLNPWRAIARAAAGLAGAVSRGPLPEPLPYPAWLGRWPAALGLVAFVWLELVAPDGDLPRVVALATLAYSALTFVAMALYGIDPWLRRGEAFSVYFNLFSRLAPFEARDGRLGVRRPLSGLAALEPLPGTVPLLAVMIGSVSFDGASEGSLWQGFVPALQRFFEAFGLGAGATVQAVYGLGLIGCIVLAYAFYRLGVAGARTVARSFTSDRLALAFVHSLVPIALVYVAAHYVSLLVFQGQAVAFLASDPLGRGWDLFGTAGQGIDYSLISATTFWYVQVLLVVCGHVVALTLAHDRALVLFDGPRTAVRSQYWLLGVMIGFTTLALWLLAGANQG